MKKIIVLLLMVPAILSAQDIRGFYIGQTLKDFETVLSQKKEYGERKDFKTEGYYYIFLKNGNETVEIILFQEKVISLKLVYSKEKDAEAVRFIPEDKLKARIDRESIESDTGSELRSLSKEDEKQDKLVVQEKNTPAISDTETLTYHRRLQDFNPISVYRDNYFLAGGSDDQVKFQISVKYDLVDNRKLLFAGFTQTSWWKLYDCSSPFYESNYQPEAFGRWEFNGYKDYIQLSPIHHCSNGKDGDVSRSINDYYLQLQASKASYFTPLLRCGFNIRIFGYWNTSDENDDFNDYRKNYMLDLFLKVKRFGNRTFVTNTELHGLCTGNPLDKGYYQVTLSTLPYYKFLAQLFVQFHSGYGESMIEYNNKENSIRGGIAITDFDRKIE